MRILQAIIVLAVLWGGAARADFVRVDYTALVGGIEGTGFGMTVGSTFSGTFIIDTTAYDRTQYCNVVPGSYQSCEYSGGSNFILGGVDLPNSADWVFVSDRLRPSCFQCENQLEDFMLQSSWHADSGDVRTFSGQWLRAFDAELDFIDGNGLVQDFSLLRSELSYYGNMYGRMSDWQMNMLTGELIYNNAVSYSLLSLTVAPLTVPEPGMLSLLGLGLAAVTYGSRRRRRVSRKQ